IAPAIVYSEGDLVKRAIRDIYHRDIERVLVGGEEVYKIAKMFMRDLTPSHAKRVQYYNDNIPLFQAYEIEAQISIMFQPKVDLPSGGSIVIHATEALVAIDVNSGRSTRERHIDDTAFKTNLEAAEEIARQMRLRDLAGLIVIDFIDMSDNKHIHAVEKRFRDSTKQDRARIQIGKISEFGLLELSRQRLRLSLMEANTVPCGYCQGTGMVRSIESTALSILRGIESEGFKGKSSEILVAVPNGVDLFLLNQKRAALTEVELRYQFSVTIHPDETLVNPDFRIQVLAERKEPFVSTVIKAPIVEEEEDEIEEEEEVITSETSEAETTTTGEKKRRRNRRRQRKPASLHPIEAALDAALSQGLSSSEDANGDTSEGTSEGISESAPPKVTEEITMGEGTARLHRRRRYKHPRNNNSHQQNTSPQEQSGSTAAQQPSAGLSAEPAHTNPEEGKSTRKGWWQRLLKS
ncbi:MAG: ribonuclease E/G, partial [Alphaproteobacteria bacterium]